MSTPPVIDPNTPINDQIYLEALDHGKRISDYITNAAAAGTYIDVKRLDGRLVVRAMKGDQDLWLTRKIVTDFTTTSGSDQPRQVTVPLDGSTGAGYTMGPTKFIDSATTPNYLVDSDDVILKGDCTAANLQMRLPATPVTDEVKIFKRYDGTDNTFIINGNGYLIDDQESIQLYLKYQTVWVQFNGTSWDILVTQASL